MPETETPTRTAPAPTTQPAPERRPSLGRVGSLWASVLPPEERFWRLVSQGDGCWLWLGAKTVGGYGSFHMGSRRDGTKRRVYAHRFSYELAKGAIPANLCLDHLCRTRLCVNPAHLETVTSAENTRRSASARKTHCIRGHIYDLSNTYRDTQGRRRCRQCASLAELIRAERRKADARTKD